MTPDEAKAKITELQVLAAEIAGAIIPDIANSVSVGGEGSITPLRARKCDSGFYCGTYNCKPPFSCSDFGCTSSFSFGFTAATNERP